MAELIRSSRADSVHPGECCYFWYTKPSGLEKPFESLPDGWQCFSPSAIGDGDHWYWHWAIGVRVADDAEPGDYEIGRGQVVTVVPKIARNVVRLDATAMLQEWLNAGYDIELMPGIHEITEPLIVPDGATIRSAGARLIRKCNPNRNAIENVMFKPLGAMTLDGLQCETEDQNFYMHADPISTGNITIKNCTFKYGNLWHATYSNMLVEDCKFVRAGTGWCPPHSVYRNNEFYGPTKKGQHSFFIVWGNILSVGNRFYETNRGPVLQTGEVSGCLFLDTYLRGVRGGEGNAGELILLEGQRPMHDNTFVDVRADHCSGPGLNVWGGGHYDNLFWNCYLNVDAVGINVASVDGGRVGANEFINVQTTGGMTLIGDQAPQSFINVHFIERAVMCGNAGPFTQTYKELDQPIDMRLGAEKVPHRFIGCGVSKVGKYEEIRG